MNQSINKWVRNSSKYQKIILRIPHAATRGVLRNVTKFTGKHLFQSSFFNKKETQASGLQLD